MRINLTLILTITLTLFSIQLCAGAVIHGAVYNWENLKPLPKAVVIVNTTPEQKYVTPDGSYSFNLPPGHYVIKAYYYQSGKVVLYAEDNITIRKNGSYILDLILFPPLNVNVSQPNVEFPSMNENTQQSYPYYLYVAILAILSLVGLVGVIYFKLRKRIKEKESQTQLQIPVHEQVEQVQEQLEQLQPQPQLQQPQLQSQQQPQTSADEQETSEEEVDTLEKEIQLLPEDLKEVLEEIAKAGGRITQKELRKRLKYSEAKVSLLLTDLERRGYIEKVKKGRGNIIFLKDEFRKVFGL